MVWVILILIFFAVLSSVPGGFGSFFVGSLGIVVAILIYNIPIFFAVKRNHPYATLILFLTWLLGWTGIVWIICLVWSLKKKDV